ncbi:energy-coupling factor ABC transporter ATP-binding protein [Bacillaceae bacterium S4-13-58]
MDKPLVSFKDVEFKYRTDEPLVLKGVNFTIQPKEWVAIIGHNGSGKSTIAKLMNGLIFPQSGSIQVGGLSVSEETIWDIRSKVGMVFQNPDNQFVGTTVKDDVAFGLENRGVPRLDMIQRIEESLKAVGMEAYANHEPHRLSGGQKQRVAIASVMAVAPEIVILDEATAMLDPRGRKEILSTIQNLRKEKELAVVTITHDLQEVMLADRVIVMNQGEKWLEGSPREIFSSSNELKEIGLDIPFVTKVTDDLRNIGVTIEGEPLNHEELVEKLWTLSSTK